MRTRHFGFYTLVIIVSVVSALAVLQVYAAPPDNVDQPPTPKSTPNRLSSHESQRETGLGAPVGDPISAASGGYYFRRPLLDLGGPIPIDVALNYNMVHGYDAFQLSYDYDLSTFDDGRDGIFVTFGDDGSRRTFRVTSADGADPRIWEGGGNRKYLIYETGPGTTDGCYYLVDNEQGRVLVFEKIGKWGDARIRWILDRNGNHLTYDYPPSSVLAQAIVEGDGTGTWARRLEIGYEGYRTITLTERIFDGGLWADGRQVSFDYDADDNLVTINDPQGTQTTFVYDRYEGDFTVDTLVQVVEPRGNAPYTHTVEVVDDISEQARVTAQIDAYGNATTLSYTGGRVIETRPNSDTVSYRHGSDYNVPTSIIDPTGAEATFDSYQKRKTAVHDRTGAVTSYSYDRLINRPITATNAYSNTVIYTYVPQTQTFTNPVVLTETVVVTFHNVTRVDHLDGSYETFAYDGHGNVTTYRDRGGETWTFTYDDRGRLLTLRNPEGGERTYTYNADGTVASAGDFDGVATTYGYDPHKRPVTITLPTETVIIAYNDYDSVTKETDGLGRVTTYAYDANNNLTAITDTTGATTTYGYDLMDRLVTGTNRLGATTITTYDALGRIAAQTDPLLQTKQYGYDPRGWLTTVTDPEGEVWRYAYNAEGVVVSTTSPLDQVTHYGVDALGYTRAISDPTGAVTTYSRDAAMRVTAVTNPLGQTTVYTYDGAGRLAAVGAADGGTTTYAYDAAGEIATITDLRGQRWDLDHSPQGRLESHTDPLGNTWTYTATAAGQLDTLTYPTGDTQTLSYDAAGNLTRRLYSADGLDLSFTYDAADRPAGTTGMALTYDAEGHIINTRDTADFGATYDAAGRLVAVTYPAAGGTFTVTYGYDKRNLLTHVGDTLTGAAMSFTYDAAGRLTDVTRSNGITTALAYDAANRLTGIRTGDIIDLAYTLDAAGQVERVQQRVPLDPASHLSPGTQSFSFDAASQVSSTGYAYDAQGRLTASPGMTYGWDGAGRLTAITDTASTALTYGGLGNLRTRTRSGSTLRYHTNRALGMRVIAAEQATSPDAYLRYYVWTPGGQLLYLIDAADGNGVSFYHFDRVGSTLALTDESGAVTDAYAYAPYGELLAHQGDSDQPFTYVGRWGVRQEGTAGTLYHMGARYYDATAARFISREPLWPQIGTPQRLQPYLYADGNPLSNIDPQALNPLDINFWQRWIADGWDVAIKEEIRSASQTIGSTDIRDYIPDFIGEHFDPSVHTHGVPMDNVLDHIYNPPSLHGAYGMLGKLAQHQAELEHDLLMQERAKVLEHRANVAEQQRRVRERARNQEELEKYLQSLPDMQRGFQSYHDNQKEIQQAMNEYKFIQGFQNTFRNGIGSYIYNGSMGRHETVSKP